MSAIKAQKHNKKGGTRRVGTQSNGEPVDWMQADGQLLLHAVATVAYKGGALRFGYTRDGGAITVGVYGDGDPYTDYLKPGDDINDYLRKLTLAWGREG